MDTPAHLPRSTGELCLVPDSVQVSDVCEQGEEIMGNPARELCLCVYPWCHFRGGNRNMPDAIDGPSVECDHHLHSFRSTQPLAPKAKRKSSEETFHSLQTNLRVVLNTAPRASLGDRGWQVATVDNEGSHTIPERTSAEDHSGLLTAQVPVVATSTEPLTLE